METGERVVVNGWIDSFTNKWEPMGNGECRKLPTKRWTEKHDISPVECLVLGHSMMQEGTIVPGRVDSWSGEFEPGYLKVKNYVKVWVVMPITHNRYRKTFKVTEDQIVRHSVGRPDPALAAEEK